MNDLQPEVLDYYDTEYVILFQKNMGTVKWMHSASS